MDHHLPSTPGNVQWGLWDEQLKPVLKISSGDRVTIETLSGEAQENAGEGDHTLERRLKSNEAQLGLSS